MADLVIRKQKCNSHTAGFKLKVISFAEEFEYAASHQLMAYEKFVCDWHKNKAKLENIPKSKKKKLRGMENPPL